MGTTTEPKPGTVFEKDGKKREVVGLLPGNRFTSPAVTWRRPGDEWRTTACSLSAWSKWVAAAQPVTLQP